MDEEFLRERARLADEIILRAYENDFPDGLVHPLLEILFLCESYDHIILFRDELAKWVMAE